MTNGNDTAFVPDYQTDTVGMKHFPLTKREYFAAMAMQGLLAYGRLHADIGKDSAKLADALITALNTNP